MNKNQIGPKNEVERYGLYLVENDEEKCILRSENSVTLVKQMHKLANENYESNMRSDNRTYEVRDDSYSDIFVIDSCNFCEKY